MPLTSHEYLNCNLYNENHEDRRSRPSPPVVALKRGVWKGRKSSALKSPSQKFPKTSIGGCNAISGRAIEADIENKLTALSVAGNGYADRTRWKGRPPNHLPVPLEALLPHWWLSQVRRPSPTNCSLHWLILVIDSMTSQSPHPQRLSRPISKYIPGPLAPSANSPISLPRPSHHFCPHRRSARD